MQKSAISWTTETWNPFLGCSKVSDGCKHCYAMVLAEKWGWTTKPWTVQNEAENVSIKPKKLHEPYKLKDASRIFVNSTSDAHHRAVPDWFRAAAWCVMLDLPQHVFQVLTKRSESLASWDTRFLEALQSPEFDDFRKTVPDKRVQKALYKEWTTAWAPHIWQGVSVEDKRVLHRLDDLRACGAVVKFVSAEPLLGAWGPDANVTGLDWIIVGGESGNHMNDNPDRWMKQEWAREIKRLCLDANVAYFYKQDSGIRTELRTYLVEEDGSLWRWHQFPGDLTPPVLVNEKDEPLSPSDAELYTEGMTTSDCLKRANDWVTQAAEYETLQAQPDHWAENARIAAAYWFDAAVKATPTPTDPTPDASTYEMISDYPLPTLVSPNLEPLDGTLDVPATTLDKWIEAGKPSNMFVLTAVEHAAAHPNYAAYHTDPVDYDWGSEPRAPSFPMPDFEMVLKAEGTLDTTSFVPGAAIWCDPLTSGEPPVRGIYHGADERQPGWGMVTLHLPTGDTTVGVSMSALHLGAPPAPPPPQTELTIGMDVIEMGTNDRGIIRSIDANRVNVQVYGPNGLIDLRDPNGQPILAQWIRRQVKPAPAVGETTSSKPAWVQAPTLEAAEAQFTDWTPGYTSVERRSFIDVTVTGTSMTFTRAEHEGVMYSTDFTPDKPADKIPDPLPSVEGAKTQDISPDTPHAIEPLAYWQDMPFGMGERLIVQHNTGAYHLADFSAREPLKEGDRVWFVDTLKRDLATFAVVTLLPHDDAEQFAVSMAVLAPQPEKGDVLRFADQWGDTVSITEYRYEGPRVDDNAGNWSFRERDDTRWQPLQNDAMRRLLDIGKHPDPEHAVPLPKFAPDHPHTITICTAQMGVTDPDMLDITVKSASTDEGKALAPKWEMVKTLSPDEYKPAFFRLIRNRYAADPTPFLNILQRDRVVLKCYCAAGEWCHRHLSVELLTSIAESVGITVIHGGEIVRSPKAEAQKQPVAETGQLSLF